MQLLIRLVSQSQRMHSPTQRSTTLSLRHRGWRSLPAQMDGMPEEPNPGSRHVLYGCKVRFNTIQTRLELFTSIYYASHIPVACTYLSTPEAALRMLAHKCSRLTVGVSQSSCYMCEDFVHASCDVCSVSMIAKTCMFFTQTDCNTVHCMLVTHSSEKAMTVAKSGHVQERLAEHLVLATQASGITYKVEYSTATAAISHHQ